MMKKCLVFVAIFLVSCKVTKKEGKYHDKENDLRSYFSNELNRKLPDNGEVFILQNQNCSACREATLEKLLVLINKEKSLPKIFIIARSDSLLERIIKMTKDFKIIIDQKNTLKDYGLNYAADLFFLIREGELRKWFEISNESLDSLSHIDVDNSVQ